jgi:DNA-binding SARP family transcriptional activator/ABC-type glycerol-3-phosphate transport system substrate-binding protein
MDYRILGPLEVSAGNGPLELGGRQQRTVLAALLLNANRVSPTDQLVDIVWGEEPPPTARRSVQAYVSRLRKVLGDDRIVSVEPGYRIRVDKGELDADRFEALMLLARSIGAGDPRKALDAMHEALSLWRGPALADLRDGGISTRAYPYDEERKTAIEDAFDLEFNLGLHEEAIPRIETCLLDDPYRERLWSQLMLALYRSGRQADALKAYGRARERLVGDLGIDPSPELRALEEQILDQDPQLGATTPTPAEPFSGSSIRNPYKGLASFAEQDADDFFGRDRLIARIVERFASGSRLVALIGSSGCGKSSLLTAGAIPALRSRSLRNGDVLQVFLMEPGQHPFEALELAIADETGLSKEGLFAALEADLAEAAKVLSSYGGAGRPTLLVVDQFEELFTEVNSRDRDRFIETVVELATCPDPSMMVLLALRADFYDRPLHNRELADLIVRGMVTVTPLDPDELRSTIVEPAARVGVSFDPDLVARLSEDVRREPAALPQLQYALTRLFDAHTGSTITTDDFDQEGGMQGILARRAESAYLGLGKPERIAARQVFFHLVRVGEVGPVTRRRAPLEEILSLGPAASEVLDRFGSLRLIGFDRDPATGQATVSLVHEALIADWERLRSWVALERVDLHLRESLDAEVRTWQESGCDPDYLIAGSRLDQYSGWELRTDIALTEAERDYLLASKARAEAEGALEAERSAEEQRLRVRAHNRAVALAVVMSIAAIVAAALTVAAIVLGRNAADHAKEAERLAAISESERVVALGAEARAFAASLAHGATASLTTDPERSLLLATHAAGVLQDSGQVVPATTVGTIHLAIQSAGILYPGHADRVVTIDGASGPVGAYDLPLPELVALAGSGVTRSLTAGECDEFFADTDCPRGMVEIAPGTIVDPLPAVAASADQPLAGTTVRVLSPWDGDDGQAFAADLARFTALTGINVVAEAPARGWYDSLDRFDVVGLVEALSSPAAGPEDYIDVGTYLDSAKLATEHHAYLLDLMRPATPEVPSPGESTLRGVPLAISVKSLVWYPAAAFADAGYTVPETWGELIALTETMVEDGRTPWCVAEAGLSPGGPATDFVEDLVLRDAGVDVFDRWVAGSLPFASTPIRRAFQRYGEALLKPGHVHGGIDAAIGTDASEGMRWLLSDEPACWLHHQGSYALRSLSTGAAHLEEIGYFLTPVATPQDPEAVLGSAVFVAARSDRPEVRELMRFLSGPDYGLALSRSVGSGFVVANRAFDHGYGALDTRTNLAAIAHSALDEGLFRLDASVAMGNESQFRAAMVSYLKDGSDALPAILGALDATMAGRSQRSN